MNIRYPIYEGVYRILTFNARGELLGLAFDGNWEAMSSDILYEPKMQRCIGVDVRYILFMIEKYGKAGNLIRELKIVSGK